ncbi:unnamed protein product [Acidithrix sp. C25]|nr:unnamed protein product [Acidithrix sp. C25]
MSNYAKTKPIPEVLLKYTHKDPKNTVGLVDLTYFEKRSIID